MILAFLLRTHDDILGQGFHKPHNITCSIYLNTMPATLGLKSELHPINILSIGDVQFVHVSSPIKFVLFHLFSHGWQLKFGQICTMSLCWGWQLPIYFAVDVLSDKIKYILRGCWGCKYDICKICIVSTSWQTHWPQQNSTVSVCICWQHHTITLTAAKKVQCPYASSMIFIIHHQPQHNLVG